MEPPLPPEQVARFKQRLHTMETQLSANTVRRKSVNALWNSFQSLLSRPSELVSHLQPQDIALLLTILARQRHESREKWQRVVETFTHTIRLGYRPSLMDYALLLQAYGKLGDVARVEQTFASMIKTFGRQAAQGQPRAALITALVDCKHIKQAQQVLLASLDTLPEPDLSHLASLIGMHHLKTGNIHQSIHLLHLTPRPHAKLINQLMRVYIQHMHAISTPKSRLDAVFVTTTLPPEPTLTTFVQDIHALQGHHPFYTPHHVRILTAVVMRGHPTFQPIKLQDLRRVETHGQ
ncbi:hypothetical protein BZG36_04652 [Bifiguratus adelaidae]|uniref:Pentacotripeptide-repeat region of PRORP domain-containing protein n=1 Tax=Bifiguratus adelaidae TaxID=1938954 RepID=A0A261Y0E5_9FUNG|nr:hypothetical protein BZG36_04652 [Bifiguratus adelaidae]